MGPETIMGRMVFGLIHLFLRAQAA